MDNICRFPKTGNLSDRLSILNFVFERTADFPPKYLTPANYAMNVVVSGSASPTRRAVIIRCRRTTSS